MDMVLNRLPSRTWNRLGINESRVAIDEEFENLVPQVKEAEGIAWCPDAGDIQGWDDVETGMGHDINVLTEKAHTGLLETKAGVKAENPVVLRYNYKSEDKKISRLKLHAEEGSVLSAVMVLSAESRDDGGISAIQTEIHAEKNALIRLYVVQLLGSNFACFNDIGGVCDENGRFEIVKLELGAGRLYAGVAVDLKGKESSFYADVGYHVRSKQKLDMNYNAIHHGEKTNSLMEVSGTLENGAKKAFRGTIDFQRGCGGSKGTESENVLLLGEDVVNQTIPLILCKEEDVEGNHGASIGKVDEKVLFYLGTRGISEEAAQEIIARSRIDAVCEKIPDEEIRSEIYDFEM